MNGESINQSFLLIDDPNLIVILNDPDVTRAIKDLIVKMKTDKIFVGKLSNSVQKDDFKLNSKKSYNRDKKDLFSKFTIMLDIFEVRKKDTKRFKEYFKYIQKVF